MSFSIKALSTTDETLTRPQLNGYPDLLADSNGDKIYRDKGVMGQGAVISKLESPGVK